MTMMEQPANTTSDATDEMESPEEESSDSATLPASVLGGKDVKVGDVVRVKVTAVADDGSVTVEAVGEESNPKMGVKAMQAEFD